MKTAPDSTLIPLGRGGLRGLLFPLLLSIFVCASVVGGVTVAGCSSRSSSSDEQASKQSPQTQLDSALSQAESLSANLRHWVSAQIDDAQFAVEELALQSRRALDDAAERLSSGVAVGAGGRIGLRVFSPSFAVKNDSDETPSTGAESIASSPTFGELWPPITSDTPLPTQVVLLVHGLDEPGTIWSDLAPALAQAGHTVLRFEYPNDQPIARSADLLVIALSRLHRLGVTHLDMVAHSMGGLVARDALTRTSGDTDSSTPQSPVVHRLIMVGTPNYGSPFAKLRVLAEIREQLMRWFDSDPTAPGGALGFLADGSGQAGRDLEVGSDYLRQLNKRPLPVGTIYTCIVGEMAPDESNLLDDLLESSLAHRLFGKNADRSARDLRALTKELGDGVVPVASAQLAGVDDVVHVHANHRTMLLTLGAERLLTPITGEEPAAPPAIAVILDRLKSE